MIAKEYIPIYVVLIVFTFIYIKSKKRDKNDNNPMNTARVYTTNNTFGINYIIYF